MIKFGRPKPIELGGVDGEGTSGAYARADHTHSLGPLLTALLNRIGVAVPETVTTTTVEMVPEIVTYDFFVTGGLSVMTGLSRKYMERNGTILRVRASVGTSPAGASVKCDVKINGVSAFPAAPLPEIAAGGFTNVAVPDITWLPEGCYLTGDITQVGSTTAGAYLTLSVEVQHDAAAA